MADATEVTIPSGDLLLHGSLRLPAGPPPHPVVAVVHGSGPVDRDGHVPGQLGLTFPRAVPVYAELADGLRAAGYAVLTWDKRTCGPAQGCDGDGYPAATDETTVDDLQRDVEAALDLLATRDDLGPRVLLGHSQGGTLAARSAATRDDLAAVVLVATPAVPIDEVLTAQAETFAGLVAAAGQDGTPAAARSVAELRQLADAVTAIADGEPRDGTIGGASAAFWRSWIAASREAPDQLARSDVPALVLGGAQDWNVLPAQVEAWSDRLGSHDELQVLSGITHALTRLDGDDPAAIGPSDVGLEVDPAVVDTIATWLDATVAR